MKALANQALSLLGHKVGVTVAIEKTAAQTNARILRGIEDRGAGEPDLAGLDNARGSALIDWANGGKDRAFAAIAPRLVRLPKYQAARQPALAGV